MPPGIALDGEIWISRNISKKYHDYQLLKLVVQNTKEIDKFQQHNLELIVLIVQILVKFMVYDDQTVNNHLKCMKFYNKLLKIKKV